MIYFITDGEYIKIGFSDAPELRIATLQTASPRELRILAIMPGDTLKEVELHNRFSHLRVRGEWFVAEDELIEFANTIKSQEPGVKSEDELAIEYLRGSTSFWLTVLHEMIDRYMEIGGEVQLVNLPSRNGMGIFFPGTIVKDGEFTLVTGKAAQP